MIGRAGITGLGKNSCYVLCTEFDDPFVGCFDGYGSWCLCDPTACEVDGRDVVGAYLFYDSTLSTVLVWSELPDDGWM